jgi:hypothetical protein
MDHSSFENSRLSTVLHTDQKKAFIGSDDGDLRVGKTCPEPRITENGDDTVTDHFSGLMRAKNANKANGNADWEQKYSGAGTFTTGV